jgi:hypothetical protein
LRHAPHRIGLHRPHDLRHLRRKRIGREREPLPQFLCRAGIATNRSARQLFQIAFQRDGQRGIERKCQSVEVDDISTSLREPNAVHDPRPDQQDVARDAPACMLDRDRPARPASTAMTTFGCAPRRVTGMGNIVLVKGVSRNGMVPSIGNSVGWRKSSRPHDMAGVGCIQRILALYPGRANAACVSPPFM